MIDLHLHLDGSLSINTVINLAKIQGISLPSEKPEELKTYLAAGEKHRALTSISVALIFR